MSKQKKTRGGGGGKRYKAESIKSVAQSLSRERAVEERPEERKSPRKSPRTWGSWSSASLARRSAAVSPADAPLPPASPPESVESGERLMLEPSPGNRGRTRVPWVSVCRNSAKMQPTDLQLELQLKWQQQDDRGVCAVCERASQSGRTQNETKYERVVVCKQQQQQQQQQQPAKRTRRRWRTSSYPPAGSAPGRGTIASPRA